MSKFIMSRQHSRLTSRDASFARLTILNRFSQSKFCTCESLASFATFLWEVEFACILAIPLCNACCQKPRNCTWQFLDGYLQHLLFLLNEHQFILCAMYEQSGRFDPLMVFRTAVQPPLSIHCVLQYVARHVERLVL